VKRALIADGARGGVAQLVRASACHAEGRGFESRRSRQKINELRDLAGGCSDFLDRRVPTFDPPSFAPMDTLFSLFPSADDLLVLSPETLAPVLLRLGAAQRQHNGMFWPEGVTQVAVGTGMTAEYQHGYPHHKQREVDRLVNETWEYLRQERMIHPAPDINGRNGWMVLSRDGEAALKESDGFARIRALRSFPKALLHPSIAADVSAALGRGDLATAVRNAFTMVEIAVREAGGFTHDDLGDRLMRKAFDPNDGPLTDMTLPENERKNYAHLFAGAIGAFKNPHSHRKVTIEDMRVALDQVLLASHLLRIVDAVKARRAKAI
jgi:uncharacterized protein (TIGR02391 family)